MDQEADVARMEARSSLSGSRRGFARDDLASKMDALGWSSPCGRRMVA